MFAFALMVKDSNNKTTATVQSTNNNPVAIFECAKQWHQDCQNNLHGDNEFFPCLLLL